MTSLNIAVLTAIVGAAVLAQTPAVSATIFDWSYSGAHGSVVAASGTLTANPLGGGMYQVTAISGNHDGSPITGLTAYANDDQIVYAGYPHLHFAGLAFLVGGSAYAVYYDTYRGGPLSCGFVGYCQVGPGKTNNGGTANARIPIDFTLAAAPEPATWALMAVGLAGLGAAVRGRRRLASPVG